MKEFSPKISVIVATRNTESGLEKTIESFISQHYSNRELIIIDGGSTDKTLDIINKYRKFIFYSVSEKDRGISDAFNKGVRKSTGDYLYFIGAGDYFWSENVLEKMMAGIDPEKDMLICGRINRTTEDGKKVLYTSTINLKKWMMIYKMGFPHQGLFTNRKYFDRYGLFDSGYKFAMDYDLLLRSYKIFPEVILKDVVVAAWKEGGVGQNVTGKVVDEYHRIRLKNKIAPDWLLNLIYLLSKWRYGIFR